MVGVCFWAPCAVLLVATAGLAKPKSKQACPEICSCLGHYLDCASHKLLTVPTNIPKWATHLNLQDNSIKKLTDVRWANLRGLTGLVLNKNQISAIPKNAFQNQTRLKILELNRNKLKEIDALAFTTLENLSILKLRRNQISALRDGAFFGLKTIDKLILDNNSIRVISKGWLYGLQSLKDLYLSHNKIEQIHDDAWEFCINLVTLDLSYNKLQSIKEDTFKSLGVLQKLMLNNNNITYIKDKAFVHLPRLKVLNLINNKISYTIEDSHGIFFGLNDLLKLHLAGNNIKSINAKAFVGLSNVEYINLTNNNITSIQNNAFAEVPQLKQLVINSSSLLCDCNLRWFLDWFGQKKITLQAVCGYPKSLRGQSLSSLKLEDISNLTCDELPRPRLIEAPDVEIMALKGENVTLSCRAKSSSNGPMTIVWKKNNVEMIDPTVTVKSRVDPNGKSTETSSVLHLNNIEHARAGKYQCVVSNNYGTTYSQKSNISVLVFPTFSKTPKNVTVVAGNTAKLECGASGEPPPEIAWHKHGNDFPAAREKRMLVMPNDDEFFIISTKPVDTGVYSCTAHNSAGTIIANVSVTVQEKPYFSKSMEDKEVIAGENLVLQCMAQGIPKPTVTWLKDGEIIVPTERHFFTAENKLAVIVDSLQTDSGIYECRVNNSLGEATGKCKIVVKSGGFDVSNMMGIMIITVVSCAVLTSIIWVVIIYQTRKQPPQQNADITELPELHDSMRTNTQQVQLQMGFDNMSDCSSSKDSGTGDSAKRSSEDFVPDEFAMYSGGTGVETSTKIVADVNNSMVPLLHYPRSTNHDRVDGLPPPEIV